uniref:RRM domain-containing protein n=2 Tax=Nelumbo nucifera TaxID=4432 RepID=A0A822Y514_NELNU|nr:TPA_asm: hypothetical protein HUJ06_029098 [Nelumbo nucifera]
MVRLFNCGEVQAIRTPLHQQECNKNGKTPKMLFTEMHGSMFKEGEEWMKRTAYSCMVVATLVASGRFVYLRLDSSIELPMRGRSYSYSPSPPRGYGRRGRSRSPRGRYSGRGRDLPTSLLVRNLRHDCRPEDLRKPFGQFGPLKDVYLPRDYYTGEPRGFGFVQYVDPADAAEAKYQMDGQILHGRELTVVFAEENRKKPTEMRARERLRGRNDHRHSPRYSRSPHYSRSPRRVRSRSRSPSYDSPSPRRRHSRSVSPPARRYSRERSYSHSPYDGSRSRSHGPSRSRSRSPEEYTRKPERERSLSQERGRSSSQERRGSLSQ